MNDLLIQSDGTVTRIEPHVAEEAAMVAAGVERPIVVSMKQEEIDFNVWCGLDPTQPVNTTAREMVSSLTGLHMIFFGPVLIAGIDDDLVREMLALYETP